MTPSFSRQLAAETVGTAFLLMAVVGSGIMGERLSGGNDALALLANTAATGAALMVLILLFGPISGAHFNPAVTIALTIDGRFARRFVAPFIAVQIIGAVAGVILAHWMFGEVSITPSTTARNSGGEWLGEVIATFGLVSVILGLLRSRAAAIPYAVGLFITAAYWFTSSTSFANPAVTIARGLTDSFSGIAPEHAPAFIVAQLAGGLLAAGFCIWLFGKTDGDDNKGSEGIMPEARPTGRPS